MPEIELAAPARVIFDVLGLPKAQDRPRAFRAGAHIRVHSPKEAWHTLVAYAAQQKREAGAPCLTGATRVFMDFRMPRVSGLPKRREVAHVKRPDLDNCIKLIDSLVPSLLADDRQVVEIRATKRYALEGESPGCLIILESVAEAVGETRAAMAAEAGADG